jgi:hypothetical protein
VRRLAVPSRALCLGGTWSNVYEQDRPSKRACWRNWGDERGGYGFLDGSKCLDGSDGRPRNLIEMTISLISASREAASSTLRAAHQLSVDRRTIQPAGVIASSCGQQLPGGELM